MKFECAHDALVDVHTLQPNPKNPNAHPARQIELLAKIISYQGQRSPIVVSNRSGFIVKGHGRLDAVKKLGWAQAAVDYQDYENEAQEYADMVADNKIAELAEHDDNAMIDGIKTLGITDFELLGLDGFSLPEVIEPQCDEDEVPEQVDTRCKLGDVWHLGRHRLMCGDSTSIDAVDALMAGEKADMVFTDPPYGVSFVGLKGSMYSGGKKKGKDSAVEIKNDSLRGDELSDLFRDAISCATMVTAEKAAFYIFFGINKSAETLEGISSCGLHIRNWLIWDKGNVGFHAMGAQYKPNFEAFLYCFKTDDPPEWVGDQNQQTIWRHSSERLGLHPTMKPVALIEQALQNHDPRTVLDLFGGSGSTLIACEKTNRRCFMIELDPHYCDVILARWEKYTGQKAERVNG